MFLVKITSKGTSLSPYDIIKEDRCVELELQRTRMDQIPLNTTFP